MSHALTEAPWWRRVLALEPTLVRGFVGLVVAALLIWGVDLTEVGEKIADTADIFGQIVALLTPLWIRQAVYSGATVVQSVEPGGVVIAGPASPLPTGMVIPADASTIRPLGDES